MSANHSYTSYIIDREWDIKYDAIDAFSSNCLIYHLFKFSQLLSWTRVPRGLASTSQRFIELLNMNEALADFRLRLIPQESRPF